MSGEPTRRIDADASYWVRTRCPSCGVVEDVAVRLVAALARTPDDCQLGVKVGQKKASHRCRQQILEVDLSTGELFADEADEADDLSGDGS